MKWKSSATNILTCRHVLRRASDVRLIRRHRYPKVELLYSDRICKNPLVHWAENLISARTNQPTSENGKLVHRQGYRLITRPLSQHQ
jgi:hypothetical protein